MDARERAYGGNPGPTTGDERTVRVKTQNIASIVADGQSLRSPLSKPAMLRRAYDWCIAAADKPYATWLMGIISFVESSFFPIPPDTMLIPMALARTDRDWFYATGVSVASMAGAAAR